MAVVSERITADVIEITEFPELAQRYHVYGVVINDEVDFEGALPEPRFLLEVLRAIGPSSTDQGAPQNSGEPQT
jgi:hypothetical protein